MDIPGEKITCDLILGWLKEQVEKKANVPQSVWLSAAFKLNLLQPDEVHEYENLRQEVAKMRFDILKGQEKKNATAAKIEVEASDLYRLMREQENKVERVEEFIRIAKKNADISY